jgi:hypothetical protein
MHMILEYMKREYRCSGNVLEREYDRYPGAIIDKNWITEIWAQISLHNAKFPSLKYLHSIITVPP